MLKIQVIKLNFKKGNAVLLYKKVTQLFDKRSIFFHFDNFFRKKTETWDKTYLYLGCFIMVLLEEKNVYEENRTLPIIKLTE